MTQEIGRIIISPVVRSGTLGRDAVYCSTEFVFAAERRRRKHLFDYPVFLDRWVRHTARWGSQYAIQNFRSSVPIKIYLIHWCQQFKVIQSHFVHPTHITRLPVLALIMKVVIYERPVMKVAVFELLLFEKGDSVILEFYTAKRKVKDNVGHKGRNATKSSCIAAGTCNSR